MNYEHFSVLFITTHHTQVIMNKYGNLISAFVEFLVIIVYQSLMGNQVKKRLLRRHYFVFNFVHLLIRSSTNIWFGLVLGFMAYQILFVI